ncbi:MAG: hypothetical protein ACLUEQ_03480 [Cloacibacillus evryensis]
MAYSAALVLGEVLSARELAGGALILGMAVCSTLKSSKRDKDGGGARCAEDNFIYFRFLTIPLIAL